MTRKLLFVLSTFALLFAFAACNSSGDSQRGGEPARTAPDHYKGSMKPLDQLAPAERIVILQNVFHPDTRDGIYTRETRPATAVIKYKAGDVAAYPISAVIELLHKGSAGTVTITKTDGGKTELSAEDFRGMYAIFDFRSDASPVLNNPATGNIITDFAYAVTSEGEAIYSVVGGSYLNVNEMLTNAGWKADATYRFVATDRFYVPVEPDAAAGGELRGGLSGVVNGSFPNLSLAGGKINDVLYIEPIVE